MMKIAQTNPQLYNQLRGRDLELDGLLLVHQAYEFLTTLYPGYYQPDGKPFVAHCVGVASILAQLDQPAELVAAGLLHNVYGNADFGDGSEPGATTSRRELIRTAVGDRVEELVARFPDWRIRPPNVEEIKRRLPSFSDTERQLLILDLADYLEKYADLAVLYFGDPDEIAELTALIGDDLIAIAGELGQPQLADALESHFERAAAEAPRLPAQLRASDGRRHVKL